MDNSTSHWQGADENSPGLRLVATFLACRQAVTFTGPNTTTTTVRYTETGKAIAKGVSHPYILAGLLWSAWVPRASLPFRFIATRTKSTCKVR